MTEGACRVVRGGGELMTGGGGGVRVQTVPYHDRGDDAARRLGAWGGWEVVW